MEVYEIIAKRISQIFGKKNPKIYRYRDEENKTIHVFTSKNVPQKGIQSYATVGLFSTDINLIYEERELRVEILGACDIRIESFQSVIAAVALDIMDLHKCYPGYIIENVINTYIPDSDMKHVLLICPFVWEKAETIVLDDRYIAWLQIIPISESEYKYAIKNSVNELENLLEEKDIDVFDIYRESVV